MLATLPGLADRDIARRVGCSPQTVGKYPRKGRSMTGAELAALRHAAGLSQTALDKRVGIGRHPVSYWETKPVIDLHAWAVQRMAEVLTMPPRRSYRFSAPDRPHPFTAAFAAQDARSLQQVARIKARNDAWAARRRVVCGVKTRKGTPCRCKYEPGKRRCKFHGGKSTGARTPEGKAGIAEANRLRWARWRAERGLPKAG